MTTSLWFVRHGPTHSKAAVGWSDIPADLSDLDALARLSNYLPEKANILFGPHIAQLIVLVNFQDIGS